MIPLTPELQARFKESNNTLISLDDQLEIGDSKQPDFYPQVKIKRWFNEANFSQRLVIPNYTQNNYDVSITGSIVTLTTPDIIVSWEDQEDSEADVIETITFINKPLQTIKHTIETKDIILSHTPKWPIDTEWYDQPDGSRDYRPYRAQGSYTIKHAQGKRNNQYKCGILGIIWRPKITDANNNSVYCDLKFSANIMETIIPRAFYDTALLPWVMT